MQQVIELLEQAREKLQNLPSSGFGMKLETKPQLNEAQLHEMLLLNCQFSNQIWVPVFAKKHAMTQKEVKDVIQQVKEVAQKAFDGMTKTSEEAKEDHKEEQPAKKVVQDYLFGVQAIPQVVEALQGFLNKPEKPEKPQKAQKAAEAPEKQAAKPDEQPAKSQEKTLDLAQLETKEAEKPEKHKKDKKEKHAGDEDKKKAKEPKEQQETKEAAKTDKKEAKKDKKKDKE